MNEVAAPRARSLKGLKAIAMIETSAETGGTIKTERRCYISSRVLTTKAFAQAARAYWAIENGLHGVLDVEFKEDQSRLMRGHGAKNMAHVRHLALNLIRAMPGKISIQGKRKFATYDTAYLLRALGLIAHQPGLVALGMFDFCLIFDCAILLLVSY